MTDDSAPLRTALVVRPSFAIEALPPIQGEPSAIAQRAIEQHDLLVTRLRANGVRVTVLEPDPACPLGFAADDLAVVLRAGAVLMRPSDLARRREVARLEAALRDAHIPIVGRIEPPGILDGGDVLVAGDRIFVATARDRSSAVGIPRQPRGNAPGRSQLAAIAQTNGVRAIEVAVASDVRRLRGVAAFLDQTTVLLGSDFVDAAAFAGTERIEVPRGEEYGAGVLALGGRRVLANLRFRTLLPLLRRLKVSVDAIDMWEFGKLGITPSTLVLALKRG